jgi:hypothetical protein
VVAELHVADQFVHAEVGVVLHLLETPVGITHHDHVGIVEVVDRNVAGDERFEVGKDRFAFGR